MESAYFTAKFAVSGSLFVASSYGLATYGCRPRTRSYDEKLKQQALAKADSRIDSQALQDPDWAKVVTAWPAQAPALKTAVLAMTESAKKQEKAQEIVGGRGHRIQASSGLRSLVISDILPACLIRVYKSPTARPSIRWWR
jgi:hypothetical protein